MAPKHSEDFKRVVCARLSPEFALAANDRKTGCARSVSTSW